jgi:CRP/FNR family transcriptional regulator, cyclic AMP receptor protein
VPQIAIKMIITLSLRLRRAEQQIGGLAFLRAPRRGARTLLNLALGHGYRGDEGVVVDLYFTCQEKNWWHLRVSRAKPSRPLTKSQQVGVLTMDRRRFLIFDLPKLEELT